MVEPLGPRIRRQRRRLGLTLDDLSAKAGISKPYLSLIETGRVPNPPSDEKLRKLEIALNFNTGDLLAQAHLIRTPKDVQAMLKTLMEGQQGEAIANRELRIANFSEEHAGELVGSSSIRNSKSAIRNLDATYLTGVLQQLVEHTAGNIDRPLRVGTVPVINKVSAGYPKDFTDLSYPKGVADAYVSCPDVDDPDAFAARVFGDSMTPKYREGDIVIFSPKAPVKEGADCFVRFEDGQTTFKRVFFEKDKEHNELLRLQPRNERYRPQIIPSERVTGLYRAVFKYQSVEE
ncbi:MAG: XRE family transcriptional regulator [Tepidisphaeraceae bacterium]